MLRFILLWCGLLSFGAAAAEPEPLNRVDFRVEASREIANDLLLANMSVEIQDDQPTLLAQQLNTILNDALKKAEAFSSVKVSSGNQNSFPVYGKNNRVDAWRGRGEIRLESRDFKAAGELIMRLQSSLQLSGLQFSISHDARAQIEDALISEAIKAFRKRAEAIRSDFGAKSYVIVRLSINNGNIPRPYPVAMLRSAPMAEAAMPAPEFSAGESRMSVQINGTIELR